MARTFIPVDMYITLMEQAVKYNGIAIIEAKGFELLEIEIDVEFAKNQLALVDPLYIEFIKANK